MGSSVCITFADAFIRNDSWLLRCLQQGSRFIISLGSVARSCQWQGSGSVMIGRTCSWGHTGVFLKWWYPQNNPKWSFLVGKPIVVGYHHFRKPLYCSWKKSSKLTSWGWSVVAWFTTGFFSIPGGDRWISSIKLLLEATQQILEEIRWATVWVGDS